MCRPSVCRCVSCLHAWFYSHMRYVANQHQTLRERKNLDHYHSLVCHIVVSHILIIRARAVTLTLKTANNFCSAWHWLILLHHHTKFGNNVLWIRRHHPNNSPDVTLSSWLGSKNQLTHLDKYSLTILTFAVTLTLNAVIQFFRRTLWLIMLYYHTKFGCKRTSNLEDIIEIVLFWWHKSSLWPWHWR